MEDPSEVAEQEDAEARRCGRDRSRAWRQTRGLLSEVEDDLDAVLAYILESGKATTLDAIDGMIWETAARIRQGGTAAQMRCLPTFLASARKHRKRIEDSSALRITAPALRILNDTGDRERARKLAKDIVVLMVSVRTRLTANHNEIQSSRFG